VLFIVSLFCVWNITAVEINSGVHLLKSQICEVPLFTSGGLGLGLVILVLVLVNLVLDLVLRIWSCLRHWLRQVQWANIRPCERHILQFVFEILNIIFIKLHNM